MEFLENDPVTDHVLDRIGHHRHRRACEIGAVAGVAERGEGLRRGGGKAAGARVGPLRLLRVQLDPPLFFERVGPAPPPPRPRRAPPPHPKAITAPGWPAKSPVAK